LSVFSFLLGPQPTFNSLWPLLGALGFFGGFFIVPISALLQHRPNKEKKGPSSASNLLSFVGIFAPLVPIGLTSH